MSLFDRLFPEAGDPGLWVLIDPDHSSGENLTEIARACEDEGVRAILIGGSLIVSETLDQVIHSIKEVTQLPVVLFPGSSRQLSKYADGILFMSLLSGRNPQYLIGEQIQAAPIIKMQGLTAISVGYLLVESGRITSTEFISNTKPLPRSKPSIAVAHAIAAELFGMKTVYLEAGSGADNAVPPEMIKAVADSVSLPVIVGGGITCQEDAEKAARAGAKAVVVGTAIEKHGVSLIGEIAESLKGSSQ